MKTEFLKGLGLEQDAIDKIMAENGKDIAAEKAKTTKADQRAQQDAAQGGPLQSYSNDGESGTFALAESIYTESGKQKKIREIIRRHLSDTGLLYAGVE